MDTKGNNDSDTLTITLTRAEWFEAVMTLNGAQNMLHGAGTYEAATNCASDLHRITSILGRAV